MRQNEGENVRKGWKRRERKKREDRGLENRGEVTERERDGERKER